MAIFKEFDTDGNGKITVDNIVEAMNKMGQNITEDEMKEILQKHNMTENGFLNYKEFKSIFVNIQ